MSYGHISSLIHLMITSAIPIPSQIMFKNYIHMHVNDVYMKEFYNEMQHVWEDCE